MIEVEAKVHISNPAILRKKIRAFARYVERVQKVDDYYTLENLTHYPHKSLRIRKMGTVHQVNFKRSLSFHHHVHAKKETEFSISDGAGFLELLAEFGFRKWVHKEKRSEIYRVRKNFHIELNAVKKLGWFLEVEYLAKPREVAHAEREVMRVLHLLGFSEKDCIEEGYTKLLWDLEKK